MAKNNSFGVTARRWGQQLLDLFSKVEGIGPIFLTFIVLVVVSVAVSTEGLGLYLGKFKDIVQVAAYGFCVAALVALIPKVLGYYRDRPRALDISMFCDSVFHAKQYVHIMDIWMKTILLDRDNREDFERAIRAACERGVEIRIAATIPESPAGRQRATALAGKNDYKNKTEDQISDEMHACARVLADLMKDTENDRRNRQRLDGHVVSGAPMEIVLTDKCPKIGYYRVDNVAYWNMFTLDELLFKRPVRRTIIQPNDDLSALVTDQFLSYFDDENRINILDYKKN